MGSDDETLRVGGDAHNTLPDETEWQSALKSMTALPLDGAVSRQQLLQEFSRIEVLASWAQRYITRQLSLLESDECVDDSGTDMSAPFGPTEMELLAAARALRAHVLGVREATRLTGIRNSIIEEAELHKDRIVYLRDHGSLRGSIKDAAEEALSLTTGFAEEVSRVHKERLEARRGEALQAILDGVAGNPRVFVDKLTDILDDDPRSTTSRRDRARLFEAWKKDAAERRRPAPAKEDPVSVDPEKRSP